MSVIEVDDLWKEYRLGVIGHGTLTHDLQSWWAKFRGNEDPNEKISSYIAGQEKQIDGNRFWALRNINFEIKQGEILGIIGKNGAGKSTLLKLLSRVTAPTRGNIKVKGRIASLLEVGTGFHPELTGRENIFMNGAILGMSKQEIKSKLDEIIDFSGVEDFVDTPVKRYSSGMYVRLAFAVAAHLEPEILVVDEVLAVGDAAFQKKCIGKMGNISREGRTILFVSHNMGAVRALCSRAIILNHGELMLSAGVNTAVEQYLTFGQEGVGHSGEIIWDDNGAPNCDEISLHSIKLLDEGKTHSVYSASKPIDMEIKFKVKLPVRGMRIIISLLTIEGVVAFSSTNHSKMAAQELLPGKYCTTCRIPADLLNSGGYLIKIHIGIPNVKVLIQGKEYLSLNIEGVGGHGSTYTEKWPGVLAPRLNWSMKELEK
ncbi:polysaccharide ABC transporter ATP-binding protein [Desulfosediminicola flagellatus]|uniref:ABC transporter ATP-binding protein n=1 Tax=Desulfosediminicola flagellatus TaxID=2569541 RepID=UPI0010AC27BD|nr:polysaccharide ABC transporter ATP-binding protein [Desulfosediminicola flagellatus]